MALIFRETIKYGRGAGFKVALAPLITDGSIIVLAVLLSAQLTRLDLILGLISLAGAAFVAIGLGKHFHEKS